MQCNDHEIVWAEKYRPSSVKDVILPESIKNIFTQFVEEGDVSSNLLLSGKPGMGKTTVALAMANDIGCDVLVIPASIENGIDVIRNKVTDFASTVSFTNDKRKIVIFDEADYFHQKSAQPALRNFMDTFSGNVSFILTCNDKSRIIDPLKSRLSVIDFVIPKTETMRIAGAFTKRIYSILQNEGVEYDDKAVVELVRKRFPDWRNTLVELQTIAKNGGNKVTMENVVIASSENFDDLVKMIAQKNFTDARKWLAVNADYDVGVFYRALFDRVPRLCKSTSGEAAVILAIAEYQYKEAFVADTEINRAAAVAQLMAEGDFK